MTIKTIAAFSFLITFAPAFLYAQSDTDVRCATYQVLQQYEKEHPAYKERVAGGEKAISEWIKTHPANTRNIVTIPVVVHLIYNKDSSNQQLSDWQVTSEIDAMNEDFSRQNADTFKTPVAFKAIAADCQIQFCLAQTDPNGNITTGIIRKKTALTTFTNLEGIKSSSQGGDDPWPYTNYMNIWVGSLSGGLLGYTSPVSGGIDSLSDGCVIHYKAFGRINTLSKKYNLGRTGTHEAGHWFNLIHIWGDDGNGCTASDSVADTPNQGGADLGCPDFPLLDKCSPDFPGVMFMNYMDYSLDSCMNAFTAGQKARMLAALNVYRSSILNSTVCNPPSTYGYDIGITAITQPTGVITTDNITPVVTLTNFGLYTLTSATIYYSSNYKSTLHQYSWTGSLASGLSVNVTLPLIPNTGGYQLCAAYTKNPNNHQDEDTTNDFKTRSYFNSKLNGVEELQGNKNETGFTVYPNPVTNIAIIKLEAISTTAVKSIGLVDILGKQQLISNRIISSGEMELNLSGLSPAIYFIRIRFEDKEMNSKIIIAR